MGEEDGGKCISTSEARFKGVNLAPKGEGGSVADGYSVSQAASRLYGFSSFSYKMLKPHNLALLDEPFIKTNEYCTPFVSNS